MKYYIDVLKKYVVFRGRARRAEYWYFALINAIISIGINLLDVFVIGTGWLPTAYSLAVLLPSLAVAVRRLHDVGKSGWMILVSLIPVIGWLWILVLAVRDSEPGENKYGPNPKGIVATVVN